MVVAFGVMGFDFATGFFVWANETDAGKRNTKRIAFIDFFLSIVLKILRANIV